MAKNKVEIQIRAEADKASKELKKFSKDTSKGLRDVKNESKETSAAFGKLKVAALAVAASYTALKGIREITGFLRDAGKAAEQEEWALRGLHQAIISMKRDVPGFEKSMVDLADALELQTGYGNDAILTAAKFLTTYKEISNEVMPRALQLTLDIARGWGVELRSAANMVGKAAMGMTGELRRYGITVDQDVYKSQGFLGVMEQIEAQVKGQAAAYRETTSGLKEFVQAVWGDVKKQFGYIVNEVIDPFRKAVGEVLGDLAMKLKEWREGVDLKTWAAEAAGKFKELIVKVADELIPTLDQLIPKWEKLLNTITTVTDKISSNFETIKKIVKVAGTVMDWVTGKTLAGWVSGIFKKEDVEKVKEGIADVKAEAEKPIVTQVDITQPKKSTAELHAEWKKMKDEMEKPIRVRIVRETIYSGGGTEYEYGYRRGGVVRKQAGGMIPGYGGGDIVNLKGEAGEFMLRKEATRSIMNAFPDLLGRMNREGARALDYMVLDLRMGGRSYPLTVEKGDSVDRLMADVRRQSMTRG